MRAATIHRYGDASVLEVEDLPTPEPRGRELLVAVRYAGVNPVDWKMREGRNRLVLGPRFPKVLGHDFAGEVIAVGPRAKRFRVGDRVFGMNGLSMGAYATHLVVSERLVAAVPPSLSLAEAAALPMTSLTALQALRDVARLREGQRLLVNGASGGVGIAAVQLGRVFGADVTGVCSARNLDFVRSLGAERVIDYGVTSFTDGPEAYDVIFDCVGNLTFESCRRALAPRGVFVSVVTDGKKLLTASIPNLFRGQRDAQVFVALPSGKRLAWIASLAEGGRYRAVVDRGFSLDEVRAAHEYSESRRARGKILLEMPSF